MNSSRSVTNITSEGTRPRRRFFSHIAASTMTSSGSKSLRNFRSSMLRSPVAASTKGELSHARQNAENTRRAKSEMWPGNQKLEKMMAWSKTLSTVQEEKVVEDYQDITVLKVKPKRSRKSTRGSLTDITNEPVVAEGEEDVFLEHGSKEKPQPEVIYAPTKKEQSFCTAFLDYPKSAFSLSRKPLISPIPLPKGVHCIDPDDGSELSYAPDTFRYARYLESLRDWTGQWKGYAASKVKRTRSVLVDWLLEVLHYFNGSQEAVYQTVHLLDRFMSRKKIETNKIQLAGVACLLIGTKLEEYYPADLHELCNLTKGCCEVKDILTMEMEILSTLDYKAYTVDPMIFINRFIRATFRDDEPLFYEACIFFLDAILCWEEYWSICPSKKSAAAVYASLNLIPEDESRPTTLSDDGVLWTPTLEYYSGYSERQIVLLSRQMIDLMRQLMESGDFDDAVCGVRNKYRSQSRHRSFLRSNLCGSANLELAIGRIHRREI